MFYVQEVRGSAAWLRGETAQHLRKVLRAERGQKYELSDNRTLWLGEVTDFGREAVEFRLLEPLPVVPPPRRAHLLAALVKFDAFEWMLEKATELGVEQITPVYSFRSDKGLDQAATKRRERWLRILWESGQQCRRATRPELGEVVRLPAALQVEAGARLFCDEARGAPPLLETLPPNQNHVALIVGPEGGWEEPERQAAAQAGWQAVSLGPFVLRAETAAIAALALVQGAPGGA